jgi:hypothetical protein
MKIESCGWWQNNDYDSIRKLFIDEEDVGVE